MVDAATSELAVVADNSASAAAGNSALAAAAEKSASAAVAGTNAAAAAGASVAVSAIAYDVDAPVMDSSAAAPDDANLSLLRGVLGEGAPRAYLQQLLDDAGNVR